MTLYIGIIAEDKSDVEVIHIIASKIAKTRKFKIKKFVGHGCGKIKGKCNAWARNLSLQGCKKLILIHDLDKKNLNDLNRDLSTALNPSPITPNIIVIPVHELEAWLLSDHNAISDALKLVKKVNKVNNPESIRNPKEYLRDLIYRNSEKKKYYLNTVDNKKIASKVNLVNLRRCASYIPLDKFLQTCF